MPTDHQQDAGPGDESARPEPHQTDRGDQPTVGDARDDQASSEPGTASPSQAASPSQSGGAADADAAVSPYESTAGAGDASYPAWLADTSQTGGGSPADAAGAVPARESTGGSRRVHRPVPRSGPSEQRAAGILSGDVPPERVPLTERLRAGDDAADSDSSDSDVAQTTVVAGSEPAVVETDGETTVTRPLSGVTGEAGSRRRARPPVEDDEPDTGILLEGASISPEPPSRAAAHWWAILLSLVGVPVAWYLLADAGARFTLPAGSPWETGNLNVAALIEFGAGLLVLAAVLLAARWSSVGAFITGGLVFIAGLPFLAVPDLTRDWLEPVLTRLQDFNDFGGNLAHHIVASGATGRFVVYGLALVLVGFVSHGARRQGRREAKALEAFERSR